MRTRVSQALDERVNSWAGFTVAAEREPDEFVAVQLSADGPNLINAPARPLAALRDRPGTAAVVTQVRER